MGYYPVFLAMDERPCVVVGGGAVAEGKVDGLLAAGARVTVISPALSGRLESWKRAGAIRHLARHYQAGDLLGFELAFAATGDVGVSAAVAQEGRERGVWVNAADDPERCDFILPSVLRRAELVVAVGTGGTSPALARAIREELEEYFTSEYAGLARVVTEVRQELRSRGGLPPAERWRQALGGDLRRLVAEGKREEAKAWLLARLGAA